MQAQQLIQAALAAHGQGRLDEAERLYRQVLAADPDNPDALHLLGVVLHQRNDHAGAAELIERAVALLPNQPAFWTNLGEVYRAAGRLDQALAAQQRAVALAPQMAEAHANLGLVLEMHQRHPEAALCFSRAVELRQDYHAAWVHLARAQLKNGKFDDAAALARHVIQLDPANADAHALLGAALAHGGQLVQAEAVLRKAIELAPADANAWAELSGPLRELGRIDEAIDALRHAVELDPDEHSRLLLVLHESPDFSPHQLAQEHRNWALRHAGAQTTVSHANVRDKHRRLRVGYVSPDFREHAVARFLEPILAAHDREQLEIFCYSNVTKPDAFTSRFQLLAHGWRDIRALTDDQAADLIRADQIDVLVDLAGHTGGNRLPLFALAPAPVQFTYLGYPNTTGLNTIGYRITDALADPPTITESFHTETLVRLEGGFLCYRPDESLVAPRAPGPFTFGSFNRGSKINDQVVATWIQILQALPESRLVLKGVVATEPAAREQRRAAFTRHGIHGSRIEFAPLVLSHSDHLREYSRVDIALDTWPYAGTTTTCEALSMGVPVVTLAGATHVSRVGVSILTHVGLPELIATDVQSYVKLAVDLAKDRDRLATLRQILPEKMKASPLCDPIRAAREIERAYRSAWQKWCDD